MKDLSTTISNYYMNKYKADSMNRFETKSFDLRKLIGGYYKGQLITVGGDSSAGKTSALLNVFLNQNKAQFISISEGLGQVINRVTANLFQIEHKRLAHGVLVEEELLELTKSSIDGLEGLQIIHLKKDVLQHIREVYNVSGIEFFIIDQIDEMDDVYLLDEFSKALKRLAQELGICIIVSASLDYEVSQRPSKEPMIEDLDHHLKIHSDIVALLYRPEVYDVSCFESGYPSKGICEVFIAKNKNGALGKIQFKFNGDYQSFSSFTTLDKIQYKLGHKNQSEIELVKLIEDFGLEDNDTII